MAFPRLAERGFACGRAALTRADLALPSHPCLGPHFPARTSVLSKLEGEHCHFAEVGRREPDVCGAERGSELRTSADGQPVCPARCCASCVRRREKGSRSAAGGGRGVRLWPLERTHQPLPLSPLTQGKLASFFLSRVDALSPQLQQVKGREGGGEPGVWAGASVTLALTALGLCSLFLPVSCTRSAQCDFCLQLPSVAFCLAVLSAPF